MTLEHSGKAQLTGGVSQLNQAATWLFSDSVGCQVCCRHTAMASKMHNCISAHIQSHPDDGRTVASAFNDNLVLRASWGTSTDKLFLLLQRSDH